MAPSAERLDFSPIGAALVNAELPDFEPRAFVYCNRNFDAVPVRRQHHARRADGDREKAPVVVERAHDGDVALEGVLAEWAAGAEGQDAGSAGDHDGAELVARDVVVPDERDAAYGDLVVLRDREAHAHFVVLLGNDLGLGFGEEVALLRVHIADLLDASLDRRLGENGVLFDLDGLLQVVVVDLVVAVDFDFRDVRALADREAERHARVRAVEVDLDVVEESGAPELPDVLGERLRREGLTRRFTHVMSLHVFAL